jgi:hypothetical protein
VTGGVKYEFAVTTLNEAVMKATERWRVLVEDPEATLPWSTHVEFYEEVMTGELAEPDKLQTMAIVRIEFDRKVVEELTGASSAA